MVFRGKGHYDKDAINEYLLVVEEYFKKIMPNRWKYVVKNLKKSKAFRKNAKKAQKSNLSRPFIEYLENTFPFLADEKLFDSLKKLDKKARESKEETSENKEASEEQDT